MGGGLAFTARETSARKGAAPQPIIVVESSTNPGVSFRTDGSGRQVMVVRASGAGVPTLFTEAGTASRRTTAPLLPRDVPVPLSSLGFETARISSTSGPGISRSACRTTG